MGASPLSLSRSDAASGDARGTGLALGCAAQNFSAELGLPCASHIARFTMQMVPWTLNVLVDG